MLALVLQDGTSGAARFNSRNSSEPPQMVLYWALNYLHWGFLYFFGRILWCLLMGGYSPIPVCPLMYCLCEPLYISEFTIYSLSDFVFTRNLMPPSMSSKRNDINKMAGFGAHGWWLRFWNSKCCSFLYILLSSLYQLFCSRQSQLLLFNSSNWIVI